MEFVIIAREGGWVVGCVCVCGGGGTITKRHSSIECSTKGHEERSRSDHHAVVAPTSAAVFIHSHLFLCLITDERSSRFRLLS